MVIMGGINQCGVSGMRLWCRATRIWAPIHALHPHASTTPRVTNLEIFILAVGGMHAVRH